METNVVTIPQVGMQFDTVEDAWKFWLNYGKQMGFDVRKHYINKSRKDGKVTSRGFVCAKEGFRGVGDSLGIRDQDDTRCNCHVRLYVKLEQETGKYVVSDFVGEHNHILHLPETVYMMRSQRKMSEVHVGLIDLASSSGIKPKAAHELMSREAGGRANLGYTDRDQKNYLRTKRQRNLMYGEAGCLLRYFQQQLNKNPSFHYAVQLDSEEQITNIFWTDARMLIDYANFGDVMTFDTTYGTNKALRPLGVFTGFNHHRGVVVFGAVLLYDETAESFKWLFESFLDAHANKKPKTIFTDQDPVMAKALNEVMPNTWHGLCTWHIMQNGIKHLGNLMKDGSSLLQVFKTCMFEYEDENKFEKSWEEMIDKYATHDCSWLDGIYKLKKKWAKCYMKNTFTLGVRSTQLSESLNGDLKAYLKSDLDIVQFFEHFERVVEQKRCKELEAEFNARQKFPKLGLKNSPLLQQATQVYTPAIFKIFQDQYDLASAAMIKNRRDDLLVHTYTVVLLNEDGEYIVSFDSVEKTISCSCRKFETVGILCCHALNVFDLLDIKSIPDIYILKRWRREAKSGFILENTTSVKEDVNLTVTQRYRRLCPKLVHLASRAADTEEISALLERMMEEYEKKIEDILTKNVADHQLPHPLSSFSGNKVVNPNKNLNTLVERAKVLKKREGRKSAKRPKSWVEKQAKKRSKNTIKDRVGQQFSKESSCPPNIQHNNHGSHEEQDFYQTYQICPSAPMMSYEFERGGSCDIGFTSFLKGPFVSTTLPSSSSQISNNANIDQGGEVGLNYILTPGVENTNAYLQTRNFFGN